MFAVLRIMSIENAQAMQKKKKILSSSFTLPDRARRWTKVALVQMWKCSIKAHWEAREGNKCELIEAGVLWRRWRMCLEQEPAVRWPYESVCVCSQGRSYAKNLWIYDGEAACVAWTQWFLTEYYELTESHGYQIWDFKRGLNSVDWACGHGSEDEAEVGRVAGLNPSLRRWCVDQAPKNCFIEG